METIWSDVLGVKVGAHDNFFELGGDSVMVQVLMLRVEEAFGVYLDPAALFDAPTLHGFCGEVAQLEASANSR